jgi:NAD-dependent deacetylase
MAEHPGLPFDTALLSAALAEPGPVVFLTGAGISAESGIPTFRGSEGYWRVGSRNYQPMELATRVAFDEMPEEVWRWYLYRRSVCRGAEPNAAHRALVEVEGVLGDRFLLVTQNVDGLHLRAGQSAERLYQIHGNIDYCRCVEECDGGAVPRPLPEAIGEQWDRERPLTQAEGRLLRCACGAWLRPHVLWFDESYDEARFRFSSTLAAIEQAALLVVVGTSGATSLPARMCERAAARRIAFLVLDPDETVFAALARSSSRGRYVPGPAGRLVPALVAAVRSIVG